MLQQALGENKEKRKEEETEVATLYFAFLLQIRFDQEDEEYIHGRP